MNKNNLFLIGSVVTYIILSSCSNHLDRSEAKELIVQTYSLPFTIGEKIQIGEVYYSKDFGGGDITTEQILSNEGLISFIYAGKKRGDLFFKGDQGRSYTVYAIDLTELGKKFIVDLKSDKEGRNFYYVKVAELQITDVTGIREIEKGKLMEIEYTWKYSNLTPFGIAFNTINAKLNASKLAISKKPIYNENQYYVDKVIAGKYDDGWRIMQGDGPSSENRVVNPKNNVTPISLPGPSNYGIIASCESSRNIGETFIKITGEGVRIRTKPDASESNNILFKLGKEDIAKFLSEEVNSKGETWYKICYDNKELWVISNFASKFIIDQQYSGNESKNGYTNVHEFIEGIKRAVLSKNNYEIEKFLNFPFSCDYGSITKSEFLSSDSKLDYSYFEIFSKPNKLVEYTPTLYGIENGPDMDLVKDYDGFWKLHLLYINEIRGD